MSRMAARTQTLANASSDSPFETHRRELTGYCYRMLGSGFEAEDAVQETMVRAWRNADDLESPAATRSWLYRIATNVCLDMLKASQRRARPMDLMSPQAADAPVPEVTAENVWLQPVADSRVLPMSGDPAELAAEKESIRLAFVAALQHLPARQRAVLILREVLRWQASEVAELLDTSVASVNSALQRARATIDELNLDEATHPSAVDDEKAQELLAQYMDAFERYDINSLVGLLADDVRFSMPPFPMWLQGPVEVENWMLGNGIGCKDSKVVSTWANGSPVVANYKPDGKGGYQPWAAAVLEISGDKIVGVHNFIGDHVFTSLGLPLQPES
jgi:RNA polymerase sigma-70 factor (ECF subfamily)